MDSATIDLALNFGIPAGLLFLAYFTGSYLERRHFASIRRREAETRDLMVFASKQLPADRPCRDARLVMGSVVISSDYFKTFLAGLRALIGGKIHAYETLLDRARREAILRMKEEAAASGANMVFNVKFETARIMSGRGKGAISVEAFAYGTAVKA